MAFTLEQMRQRVYNLLRDSERNFISPEMVAAWLNMAQADLCLRTKVMTKQATGSISVSTLALPTDFVAPQSFTLTSGDTTERVEFTNEDIFDSYQDAAESPPRTLARVFDENIEIYPTPSAGTTYELRFSYIPADLDDSTDTCTLPMGLQLKMVSFAVAQAKYAEAEIDEADRFLSDYERELPVPNIGKDKYISSPISILAEPTAPELQQWVDMSGELE